MLIIFHLGKILAGPKKNYTNTGPNSFGTDAVAAIYLEKCTCKKLWNPAIPDWRTWSKFGEHQEYEERG